MLPLVVVQFSQNTRTGNRCASPGFAWGWYFFDPVPQVKKVSAAHSPAVCEAAGQAAV